MSSFQINNTPTRGRPTSRLESREPTEVHMAPFSSKAIVQFEDVPVAKTAKRILKIVNPTDEEMQVKVTKTVKADYNITLSWTEAQVPAREEIIMEMVWNPKMAIACKESMQLTDDRNFRKDVVLILKSVESIPPKSHVRRFPTLSSGIAPHRKKSPTSSTMKHSMRRPLATGANARAKWSTAIYKPPKFKEPRVSSRLVVLPLTERNYLNDIGSMETRALAAAKVKEETRSLVRNINFTPGAGSKTPNNRAQMVSPLIGRGAVGKENVSPLTPTNLANLIDQLNFTPVTDTKSKVPLELENLASLPTPEGTPSISFESSNAGEIVNPDKNNPIMLNQTFVLTSATTSARISVSPSTEGCLNVTSALNRTTTIVARPISPALNIIHEEDDSHIDAELDSCSDKTYLCETANVKRDIQLVGTQLRKYSESMKDLSLNSEQTKCCTHGSMPNLNEMETVRSFDQNRFLYHQEQVHKVDAAPRVKRENKENAEKTEVLADGLFNQTEILAQSSTVILNEVGLTSEENTPIRTNFISRNIATVKTECTARADLNSKANCGTTVCAKKRPSSSLADSPRKPFATNSLGIAQASNAPPLSPPKRQRMDMEYSRLRSSPVNAAAPRNKGWSQTQPKKFGPYMTLSKLPARKMQTGTKLYDAELYMAQYINPDPFAATTTSDPFLASTIYLDDQTVERNVQDFKKWLNALITIPSELEVDCNAKLDVGRLFNEVRNKQLTLAPTKEQQSMQFFTQFRLESLRRAAIKLYMSEELRVPCAKVAVYVNKNAMRIRSDRNLHLDVVTQRNILELLLSFNPLWLRLGLEVVYGEKIHLNSNSDVVGLSTFILNRLFRDRSLEQRHQRAFTLSQQYAVHMKQLTLQKTLLLLLFLDKAKTHRIITHNPCLFVKSSPYKETREILLRFSSELLANMGDITRELKRSGYVLEHKQTYLDEFDYAFKDLAMDLRDGVRLTRVMEIILLRNDLSQQLRVPAISRLQRIFNVNLALKALSQADFELRGEITAADIVDGHREKTLSLLWQIIYKFRSPKFHAAAKVLQTWWRQSWLRVAIRRRIQHKELLRREAAATMIQACYRGFVARNYAKSFRRERTQAAVVLQKYVRRHLAQKEFGRRFDALLKIQRWYRAQRQGEICRQSFRKLKNFTVFLQRYYRRRMLARKLALVAHQAILYRAQQREAAAICIQTQWRARRVSRAIRTEFLKKRAAAIVLQSSFRGQKAMQLTRSHFTELRNSTINIQRRFRANRLMIAQREEYLQLKLCVVRIQHRRRALVLMRQVRKECELQRCAAISLQRRVRAFLEMKQLRAAYLKLRAAACVLQQRYRARLAMKQAVKAYDELRHRVVFLQRKWRETRLARTARAQFISLQYHAVAVQQRFRGKKLMRVERAQFLRLRAACIQVQQRYRAKLHQRQVRMEFEQKKLAVVVLQRAYRARLVARAHQASYARLKRAAICLQQCYRAKLQMRRRRQEFLSLRNAVVRMQRRFRANQLQKKVRSLYLRKRAIIVKLQLRFRATKLMRRTRADYLDFCQKVRMIQTRYRAKLIMKREFNAYHVQRQAAVQLQTWYRSVLSMRKAQKAYQRTRSYCVIIQRKWRAILAGRRVRQYFLTLRECAVRVQRKLRATMLMRRDRQRMLQLRQATIVLQTRFRAQQEMLKIRSQYQLLLSLVICIQRKFRTKRLMLAQRQDYLLLKRTTVRLQQRFRGRRQMETDRKHFLLLKLHVVDVQARARGLLARQRFHALMTPEMAQHLREKRAALLLQRFWRGYRVRKRLRNQRIEKIRQRVLHLKAVAAVEFTVRSKVQHAVSVLRGQHKATEMVRVLATLERLSRNVPHLLMPYCEFISTFCYAMMAQAIRSEVDKLLIEHCSHIILNLSRCNRKLTFQQNGLVTIAQMLLRWCDKDSDIFITLCTLIWVFIQCPERRKIIRQYMTTTEAYYMVSETKKLVVRKEKMKMNMRKPQTNTPRSSMKAPQFSTRTLPCLEPDYGVLQTRPYTFLSSVFAFDSILCKLNIDLA